ncbi:SDR family oxidoreductase [Croceivirga thetidis]|uniref:SDR family oxidoreductase n=1 Tax=Croceivirga thetidis TaxID=2721623 RepID=A0ABX1GP72_9FLAO|nr:SDR family oxidoreductase [Croceivirga thetidis]NKI31473.1 SDR family oxidoreductase [Croceivirga thetidis]
MAKVVITGANGGFGALTVKTLLKNGHEVVATMRSPDSKNKASADELSVLGAKIINLDVTDEESVNEGIKNTIELLGGLDVVINNAGIGVLGIQEQFTIDDFKKLFDVNVFGVQRVNRAALPHLRKEGSGLLIHISSILGRITFPFYGPYNASKWAVEALAENYRIELSGFGVDSCLVEPGGYPTGFFDNLMKPSDRSQDESYGEMVHAPKQAFDSFEGALANNPVQDPQNVADAIVKLINTPAGNRPARTVVDKMGMGDHIGPYNNQLAQIHEGLFNAFGMGDMLKLKV